MNKTEHHKQSNVARRGSLARLARSADAARDARMLLRDEVRARREQERAMLALWMASAELPAQSPLQSVAQTLREHPVGIGIGALAAGVALARAMQSTRSY